jgi:acid phosphatase (class A)
VIFGNSKSVRSAKFGGLLLLVALALPARAENRYLPHGGPDGISLLAPPPADGSLEAAADLGSARAVFNNRTAAEEARATQSSGLSFSLFAAATGTSFNLTNLPLTKALLEEVKLEIGPMIDAPKMHWKRQRPYVVDPRLTLGNPEPSFSYPSGHSTRGTVYSMVIAELFPERAEAILSMGRQIGWDRVLIGKHFPTDIYAGRVLGKAIVRELKVSAEFQKDLAAAKAEIAMLPASQLKAAKATEEQNPPSTSFARPSKPEHEPALLKQ